MKKIHRNWIVGLAALVVVMSFALFSFEQPSLTGNVLLDSYEGIEYAPPYDVFSSNSMVFNISPDIVTLSNDILNFGMNVSLPGGYVYKKGFVYNFQTDSWDIFNFDQTPVGDSYWIQNFASKDLIVNASEMLRNGENYVVAYACKKNIDGVWNCGCSDASGSGCRKWMLQVINVSNVPIPANDSCLTDADCGTGNCTMGSCVIQEVIPPMSDSDGDGYIEIYSCEQLQNMSLNLNANYELGRDVDCSDTRNLNGGAGFNPVGYCGDYCGGPGASDYPFNGNFNGNDNIISNLVIHKSKVNLDYGIGLFGYATGNISNVGLVNVSVIGKGDVGGLVGWQTAGGIYNSYSTGSIDGIIDVGGLVARSSGIIYNSYSITNVSGSDTYIGGLVGFASGIISDSYSMGLVSAGSAQYVGGLVGVSYGIINRSYSSANADGWTSVGGLVGWQTAGGIYNSYSTGNVTSVFEYGYSGGLVGWQYPGTVINNSYSVGGVVSSIGGGLIGKVYLAGGTNTNSYWDNQTSGQASSAGGSEVIGKTTNDMKQQATYSGWDFVNTWKIADGEYPKLKWQN